MELSTRIFTEKILERIGGLESRDRQSNVAHGKLENEICTYRIQPLQRNYISMAHFLLKRLSAYHATPDKVFNSSRMRLLQWHSFNIRNLVKLTWSKRYRTTGIVVGTCGYMSPEYAMQEQFSVKSGYTGDLLGYEGRGTVEINQEMKL